jgi:hypothetical protein
MELATESRWPVNGWILLKKIDRGHEFATLAFNTTVGDVLGGNTRHDYLHDCPHFECAVDHIRAADPGRFPAFREAVVFHREGQRPGGGLDLDPAPEEVERTQQKGFSVERFVVGDRNLLEVLAEAARVYTTNMRRVLGK